MPSLFLEMKKLLVMLNLSSCTSFLATACRKHPFCSNLIELPAEGHLLGNHWSVKNPNYCMFVKGRKITLHLNVEWGVNQRADELIWRVFFNWQINKFVKCTYNLRIEKKRYTISYSEDKKVQSLWCYQFGVKAKEK